MNESHVARLLGCVWGYWDECRIDGCLPGDWKEGLLLARLLNCFQLNFNRHQLISERFQLQFLIDALV